MKTYLETTMHGYDTIVAITQNNINANFEFLYEMEDGIKPEIAIKNRRLGEINATIAPPTVRLNVKNNPNKVIFKLELTEGTFKYYKSDNDDEEMTSETIKGWLIGFQVNLDISDIEEKNIPEDVKKTIKRRLPNGTIDPSMFSVRQLFMHFQHIVNLDSHETTFPANVANPTDSTKLKDAVMNATFMNLLNFYIQQIKEKGHNILGYAINVKNPNVLQQKTPSFPPTNLTYTTNMFLPDGIQKPDFSSYDAGIDTLNYLMMTNNKNWPTANPSAPSWFGNWVTDNKHYGIIAVSRQLFVENFLLGMLSGVTTLTTDFYHRDVQQGQDYSYKQDSNTMSNPARYYVTQPGKLGTYTYDSGEMKDYLELTTSTYCEDHTWRARHTSLVTIEPGKNVIHISGVSTIKLDVRHWGGARKSVFSQISDYWHQGEVKWSTSITLSSVTTGSLSANVAPVEYVASNTSGKDKNTEILEGFTKLFGGTVLTMTTTIKEVLSQAFASLRLQEEIQYKLNSCNIFVFPGGQEFRMSDPIFNNELDLLANIQYEFY